MRLGFSISLGKLWKICLCDHDSQSERQKNFVRYLMTRVYRYMTSFLLEYVISHTQMPIHPHYKLKQYQP